MRLKVQHGSLSLSTIPAGLTFKRGDGTDDRMMVFTGSLSDINAALESLVYEADGRHHWGHDKLKIRVTEVEPEGGGEPLWDAESVNIICGPQKHKHPHYLDELADFFGFSQEYRSGKALAFNLDDINWTWLCNDCVLPKTESHTDPITGPDGYHFGIKSGKALVFNLSEISCLALCTLDDSVWQNILQASGREKFFG